MDEQLCYVSVTGGTSFPGQSAGAAPGPNEITDDGPVSATAFPATPPTADVYVEIWSPGGGGGAGNSTDGGAGGSNGQYVALSIPAASLADAPTYALGAGGVGGKHGGAAAGAGAECVIDLGTFGELTIGATDVAGLSGTGPAMPGAITNTTGLTLAVSWPGTGAPA